MKFTLKSIKKQILSINHNIPFKNISGYKCENDCQYNIGNSW